MRYAAYGSNTDEVDWKRWCAKKGYGPACIRAVGRTILPDVGLVFNYSSKTREGGVVNLAPMVGAGTECVHV